MADPPDAVRALAQQLVTQAELREPPMDLGLLGSVCGVVEVKHLPLEHWGMLIQLGDGQYRVLVDSGQGGGRARFTHAHEIGHILVSGASGLRENKQDAETGMYRRDVNEEEYLCDVAASELLMPTSVFHPFVATRPLSLGAIVDIAEAFETSLEAAAYSDAIRPPIPIESGH
jgi:hypothetical protein